MRYSVVQRLSLWFLVLTLLVAAAAGIGFWFANVVQGNTQAIRRSTDQSARISDIQHNWLTVVGILDSLAVNRRLDITPDQLKALLDDFVGQLEDITNQPLGISEKYMSENQEIAQEMLRTGAQMSELVVQINRLVEEDRWGVAMQIRQSRAAPLQPKMDENLKKLNQNIQEEVAAQLAEVERLQNLTRIYWYIAIVIALVLSVIIAWLARRSIALPITQLTHEAERITGGDLSPVAPLPQQDEIGNLSRAFATMTDWLRESYETLEKRVEERTRSLEQRTLQIEVAAQVARDIAATRNLTQLLEEAVNLIRDRFGFYHAGIFLNDVHDEYAVLRAATGEAGAEMLARGHKLRIGETGLVGYATHTGKPRIALDVGQDAVHFKNPLLPETRSEVALPLKVGNRIIGALDVQSKEAAAFDEDSITILQVMADQLAIAIENSKLLQEVQDKLNELEAVYGGVTRQTWERIVQSSQVIGYQYDGMDLTPISPTSSTHVAGDGKPVSIPLQLRGQVIGTLDVWPKGGAISQAEEYVLTSLSNRISQILESVLLFEEARTRAIREQLASEVTSRIRATLDIETVLRTAVQELQKNLQLPEILINLGSPGDGGVTPGDESGSLLGAS